MTSKNPSLSTSAGPATVPPNRVLPREMQKSAAGTRSMQESMETELEITTDGRALHIVPRLTGSARRQRVKAAIGQVMTKHKKTFEKLAK
jgi:hypothetical protein